MNGDRVLNTIQTSAHSWIQQEGLPRTAQDFDAYLAEHGRSFHMASRIVPEPYRSQLVGVYAYCRYTDDLVDQPRCSPDELHTRLSQWEALSRRAYNGESTGIELLDAVIGEMGRRRVPFTYVEGLMNGMRTDIDGAAFETREELEQYCHNVASVVGLWLSELFGVHDAWALERARKLGLAMQLTNIVRDVGEDRKRNRLYLPKSMCDKAGVSVEAIDRLLSSDACVPDGFKAVLEDLMQIAEMYYDEANEAMDRLPGFFRPAVAVASRVYRGIHNVVRSNGYDTIRRRAVVSDVDRTLLARSALGARAII